MFFFFKSFVAGYITAGISSKPSTTLGWKTHEALWPIYLFGRFGETRCCICSAEVLTQAERRLFRWWSICLRREIFGERSTILWRIYRIQFTDRSDFVHRSQRPQDAWKKPSLFLHFKLMDTKQQPAVILRLFFFFNKPGAIALRNISAFLLLDLIGNCLRKRERTQRGKECQSYFPQIFSISCPRSSPFPSTAPRARKSERKGTEQGGEKRKRKQVKAVKAKKEEGKRRKGSSASSIS